MLRLITQWAYLEQEFGCSIRERFLMAVRSLDNPKAVTPFLLQREDRRFGLFLHVEKGNVAAAQLPEDIVPVYYRPYFTFDVAERSAVVHRTLLEAVESLSGGERRLIADAHAPLAVVDELRARFDVRKEDGPQIGTVSLRKVSCAEVARVLGSGRPAAARAAAKLLDRSPVRDQLLSYLEAHPEDRRFATLNAALTRDKLAGVIVSSTLNMQELGGVPVGAKQRPLAVFYGAGDDHVWVVERGIAAGARMFSSPAEALEQALPTGTVGVEAEDVEFGLGIALALEARDTKPAGGVLRRWRDENALPDLPYYVIATRTTRHAIESALDFARAALARGNALTESDAYAVYLRAMRNFAAGALPGTTATRTLTNFHSGARSLFPSNAAPFPITPQINTLKIDAGCLLFDANGVLLGCSDIARTLSTTREGRELYDVFKTSVREVLVPSVRAGRTGEEIHAIGAEAVWKKRGQLSSNSLFVNLGNPAAEYDRDVGHLLGKNNLAHLRLVPGDKQKLQEGMIACCEYQWPIRGHAIAYEDTCLVTPNGGLNLTADA